MENQPHHGNCEKKQKTCLFQTFVWLMYVVFQASGEKPERMSNKDAAMFPIIASCTLFGIYIFFQVCANFKIMISLLKTGYIDSAVFG